MIVEVCVEVEVIIQESDSYGPYIESVTILTQGVQSDAMVWIEEVAMEKAWARYRKGER